MDIEQKRDLIRAALSYRSGQDSINSVYMGSMATFSAMGALGERYGFGNLERGLANASEDQIDACLKVCKRTIDYMLKHPTSKCPCCGQIVPAKK